MKTVRVNARKAVGALAALLLISAMAMPAAGHAKAAFAENATDDSLAADRGAFVVAGNLDEGALRNGDELVSESGGLSYIAVRDDPSRAERHYAQHSDFASEDSLLMAAVDDDSQVADGTSSPGTADPPSAGDSPTEGISSDPADPDKEADATDADGAVGSGDDTVIGDVYAYDDWPNLAGEDLYGGWPDEDDADTTGDDPSNTSPANADSPANTGTKGANSADASTSSPSDENPDLPSQASMDNPVQALEALGKPDVDSPGRGTVALIDTGAPSLPNVVGAVSVIGEETLDDNGHASALADAMVLVNPNVQILSIKALDSQGKGSVSSVAAAMRYAIDAGADVINLSLTDKGGGVNPVIAGMVDQANDAGITVVGAAGNDGYDAAGYTPGGIEAAFVVGARDENGTRLESSNFGHTVDAYVSASSTSEAAAKASAWLSRSPGEDGIARGLESGFFTCQGQNGAEMPGGVPQDTAPSGKDGNDVMEAAYTITSSFTVANVGSNKIFASGSFTLVVENVGTVTVTGIWRNKPSFENANGQSNAINWSISGDTSRIQLVTTQSNTVNGKGGGTNYVYAGINFNVLMPTKRVGTGFSKTMTPRSFMMEPCDVSTDADYSASSIGLGQDGTSDRWLPLHTYVNVEALGLKTSSKKRYTGGTLAINTTLTSSYADVNGLLDGAQNGGIAGYGTFDFNVGGTCVANDVSDYYSASKYGSSWSISDIRATTGHTYDGVAEGGTSGTFGASNFQAARLKFHTNTYTVNYNANGATSGSTPSSSHVYGQAKNLTANGYERPGYRFLGWSADENAEIASYGDGQSVSNLTSQDQATITLYAVWSRYATMPNTGTADIPAAATALGISGLATGVTLRSKRRGRSRP